jgi:hypothetical protein
MWLVSTAQAHADDAGFQMVADRYARSGIGLEGDALDRVLERLRRHRLVEVDNRGSHRMRFVRVRADQVRELLDL